MGANMKQHRIHELRAAMHIRVRDWHQPGSISSTGRIASQPRQGTSVILYCEHNPAEDWMIEAMIGADLLPPDALSRERSISVDLPEQWDANARNNAGGVGAFIDVRDRHAVEAAIERLREIWAPVELPLAPEAGRDKQT